VGAAGGQQAVRPLLSGCSCCGLPGTHATRSRRPGLRAPTPVGVRIAAAKEAVDCALRKFGKEAGREETGALTRPVEGLAARHGAEALKALHRCG
jgi:hypothetical protein